MAEALQSELALQVDLPPLLASGGRAPSFLNGGFEEPQTFLFMGLALVFAGVLDLSKPGNEPGEYFFDPLKLREVRPPVIGDLLPKEKSWMAEAELKNGRLAMLAISFFVFYEYTQAVPILQFFSHEFVWPKLPQVSPPDMRGIDADFNIFMKEIEAAGNEVSTESTSS